jgi:hypothetical protein
LKSVKEDLNNMGARNWRPKSQDQEQWRTILEEAKVHQELKCQKKNKDREKERNWKTKDSAPNDSIPSPKPALISPFLIC